MQNPIIRFGLIGGIILVILSNIPWLIWGESMSYTTAVSLGYLSVAVALSSIYFGVRKYRDEIGGGVISFGKAFKIGLLTALIPSGFIFVSTVIFYILNGENFQEWAIASMEQSLPPEQFQAQMAQIEAMGDLTLNPFFQGFVMFMTVFVIGLLVSLVVAWILKKERKNTESVPARS